MNHYLKYETIDAAASNTAIVAKPPQKCTCVPSGQCHSGTLIGCPHNHYYNEYNVWTCDHTNKYHLYGAERPFDQNNDDAARRYLSAFSRIRWLS